MAVTYNGTDCKSPSTSVGVTGEYDVSLTLAGMTGAVNTLISRLVELNAKVCDTKEDTILKQNAANLLITELGTRLGAIEVITNDLQDVIGLTPEQIAVLSEAAGFLSDEDGNAVSLGSVMGHINSINSAISAFSAALAGKADKTITDDHEARIASLESAGIDLSGYATIADLCGLATATTDALDAVFSKTKAAFQSVASSLNSAAVAMQDAANGLTLADCVLTDYVPASIPPAITGGSDAGSGAPV